MVRDIRELPPRGRIVVDSAPIIYLLEDHADFAPHYATLFERAEAQHYELVISTVTLVEVLTGPLRGGDEALAGQYWATLTSPPTWRVVDLNAAIAYRAARIRARSRLRLPDAVQMATALETASTALVTHDGDFSSLNFAALSEGVTVYFGNYKE